MKSQAIKITLSKGWDEVFQTTDLDIRKVVVRLLSECNEDEVLHFFTSDQNFAMYRKWGGKHVARTSFRLPNECFEKLQGLGKKTRASYGMIILYLLNRAAQEISQERALEDELWSLVQTELKSMEDAVKRLRAFQKELEILNEGREETMVLYELSLLVNTYEDLVSGG